MRTETAHDLLPQWASDLAHRRVRVASLRQWGDQYHE